jgi:hypothetical protein
MLLKNLNVGLGLVNGARGAVVSFSAEGSPVVRFLGGATEVVRLHQWQVKGAAGHLSTRLGRNFLKILIFHWQMSIVDSENIIDRVMISVSDPDPYVFGPHGSGSGSGRHRYEIRLRILL